MEYHALKEKICVSSTVFAGTKEQPIDIDLSLPDYCPDVRRVLKCRILPQINSRSINGDILEIDGTALISVLYSDSDGVLRCYEHSMPFNSAMSIKNSPDDYIIFVNTKTEYINCRALTPRRLDLHGAFSVCAKVVAKAEKELVTSVEGDDIEQKLFDRSYSQLKGFGQQTASITEITALPQGKPPVQSVLRREADVSVDDIRIVPDKAMVSGNIHVRLFYCGNIETGSTELFEYEIPFNKIMDAAGVDSDCRCNVSAELNSISVSTSDDNENEVVTEIRMTLCALCYKECAAKCVADAYSTRYNLKTRCSQVAIPDPGINVNEVVRAKSTIDFGEKQISRLSDIWCEILSVNAECTGGCYVIKGKLSVNIIAVNEDDEPFFTERTIDISCNISDNEKICDITSELYAHIMTYSYRLNGTSSIDFSADIKVCGEIFRESVTENVISAEADTEAEPEHNDPALILYYAEKGESLWEIAKRYRTPIKGILEENEISEDDLANGGLLVLPSF